MKAMKTSATLFVLVLISILSSCNEEHDPNPLVALPPTWAEQFEIHTFQPIVSTTNVTFKGNVTLTIPDHSIKYGFMWYRKSETEPNIHNLQVGEGSFTGGYELEISSLPKGEDLVVCAFLMSSLNSENVLIGEEWEFRY